MKSNSCSKVVSVAHLCGEVLMGSSNPYARFCFGSSRHLGPALGDRSTWRRQHVVACFCCLPASASSSGCRLDPCRPRRRQSVWRFPTTTGSARFRLPAAGSLASPSVSGWCRLRGRPRRSRCGRTLRRRIPPLCTPGRPSSASGLDPRGLADFPERTRNSGVPVPATLA